MYKPTLIALGISLTSLFFFFWERDAQQSETVSSTEHIQTNTQTLISPEEAQAIALNNIKTTETGVELSHPNHHVEFAAAGVVFEPRKGPEWKWELSHIGTEKDLLQDFSLEPTQPENNTPRIISYARHQGKIIEEYHAKQNTIEQRFVINEPLSLDGHDLVIQGNVSSEGEFEELESGWAWRDDDGQVELGDVTVFDAEGTILTAHMTVTDHSTEIIVDAQSLAAATYPVTVDPEIGANDFRISDMGPNGNVSFDAINPAVAYNSIDNEYLVVWSGSDSPSFFIFGDEFEIYGQRIDASTGSEIGINDSRLSDMGSDGDSFFDAMNPAVAYNSLDNEYLVVWEGDDDIGSLVEGEFEIFGQRLTAAGVETGANDFRISDMGPDGVPSFDALKPDVSYNSADNEYLVVWGGDGDTTPLVDDEFEIYGQRLDATGGHVGTNDFRISDMGTGFVGPDGDPFFDAMNPAVAYNSADNEYLVVWEGDDDVASLVDNEFEIFGQRLTALGAEIGINDFRISDMGPDADSGFGAANPDVAYNSTDNEYLIVWQSDDSVSPLVDDELEIYGQLLTASGDETGANDFRISDMGPDGDTSFNAMNPAVTYNSNHREYLVVWEGDDGSPLADGEFEIYGQSLTADGIEIGGNDVRLSDMGTDGDSDFDGVTPAIAYSLTSREYLIVWSGDDNISPLVEDELEIFAQRFETTILSSLTLSLSVGTGGVVVFTIDAGPAFAGLPYLMLGSFSGTSPGLPFDGQVIPLNPDTYLAFSLSTPNSSLLPDGSGFLDASGRATARFVLPPGSPLAVGTIVNHACVIYDTVGGGIQRVGNPFGTTLVP